ncbi:hypothetical protein DB347_10000 [Opitutaceae bacterium EW11]|nr:hypothetical protein DB347_10000 [Opitutaceae bacterium EW11]
MKPLRFVPLALTLLAAGAGSLVAQSAAPVDAPNRAIPDIKPENAAKVDAALPAKALATPKKPRLILVCARTEGFFHTSIPTGLYALKRMGEQTGAYRVEVNNEMGAFAPENLKRFDGILFLNTTQLKFQNPAHRQALIDFVRSGKGLIGIHAASDNFPTWLEGQALMGGVFHSHPWVAADTVAVKLDEPDHVLNRAFGGHGFWIPEEIYQIVGPYSREKQRVLTSLDMSKPNNQRPAKMLVRADRDFPIGWIKPEGSGRVFYSSLGHNDQTFWTPEVLQQYLDGIQYALGDLDAPDAPSAGLSPAPQPALAPEQPVALLERHDAERIHNSDTLAKIAAYREGDDTFLLKMVDSGLRQSDAAGRARFEDDLIQVGSRPTLSPGAKKEISNWLSRIGTAKSVSLLAQWSESAETADPAIRALTEIPGDEADAALAALLRTAPDAVKPAVLSGLSLRRPAKAVSAVTPLLKSEDPALAGAALDCLARIGSPDALAALKSFSAPKTLVDRRGWALIRAAALRAADGDATGAAELRAAIASAPTFAQKRAAAEELIRTTGAAGLKDTQPLLTSAEMGSVLGSAWLRAAVAGDTSDHGPLASLTGGFSALPPRVQGVLLFAATQIAQKPLVPLAQQGLKSPDRDVRLAAISALGACGASVADAEPLIAGLESKDDRPSAVDALSRLRAAGIDDHLRSLQSKSAPAVQAALLEIAGNRIDRASMTFAVNCAGTQDRELRQAAFKAVRVLVQGEDLPLLFKLQSQVKTAAERRAWSDAVMNAVRFRSDAGPVAELLDQQLAKASPENRLVFIAALSVIDGDQADAAIDRLLRDSSVERRKEVIRALSSARNARAAKHLIGVAETGSDETERILALRGFVDSYVAMTEPRPAEKIEAYRRAWKAAQRDEERDAIIAAMDQVESLDGRKAARELREQRTAANRTAARTP